MLAHHAFHSPDYVREVAIRTGVPRVTGKSQYRRRKDRHGRGARGPQFHPALPAWATRKEQFYTELVMAISEMAAREPAVADIEFGIQDVPPSDPAEWEEHDVVLSRTFPRDRRRGLRDRIIVYRYPVMSRATNHDLPLALRIILAERICEVLAISPEDLLG